MQKNADKYAHKKLQVAMKNMASVVVNLVGVVVAVLILYSMELTDFVFHKKRFR